MRFWNGFARVDRRVKAVWAICPIQNELCWCWGNESLPRIGWCGKIQFLCWWKQLLMEIGWGYYAEETDGDGEQMPLMPASSCSCHGGGWRWFWWGSFLSQAAVETKWGHIPVEHTTSQTGLSPSMGTEKTRDCRDPKYQRISSILRVWWSPK